MSDFKSCPSCGTSIFTTDAYCHKCGLKQSINNESAQLKETAVYTAAEQAAASGTVNQDPAFNEQHVPASATPEVKSEAPAEYIVEAKKEAHEAPPPVSKPSPMIHQPEKKPVPPKAEEPKKKKFPWFFSFLWLVSLLAVGVWAYFLFISEAYPKPVFTEDAQRIIIFIASVFLLIYTLSLKLSVKKLKALPAIILIIAVIIGFYFFCMIELIDGDWLHDRLSELTRYVLPVWGE